ncbi:hypothetical protein PAHAL_5G304600 [Panicum hallii]|uniref:Uncharacterized protein n=1 Tax=Panicum hallii TaxID=206008 RepID=A0A2T8ILR8_9POAL|nr:hypothetical protein PAHAL_5G304600 [Panicum hallii]
MPVRHSPRLPSPPLPSSLRSQAQQLHREAAALHAARLRSAVCAAGGSACRPVRLRPRLPRAVGRWHSAAPLAASHRPAAATTAGARQATARSRSGAARPNPSANRPTRRVPNADSHQLQQAHGRRQGHPHPHPQFNIIIQKEHLHGGYSLRFFYTDRLGC